MDYALQRSISDIQSKISTIDHQLLRMRAGAPGGPPPGAPFFAQALAAVHRLRGEHGLADRVEERAAVAPAQTTVAGWASELTQSPVGGLLLAIAKQSAYASVAARTPLFSLDTQIAKVIVGGDITAGFVAESQPANVAAGSLSPLTLTPKKLVALTTFSEELLNYGINLPAILRTLLTNGIATALDTAFFGTAAASSAAPAGILNGIVALTATASGTPSEKLAADLKQLLGALVSPTDVCFVTTPTRAVYMGAVLPGTLGLPIFGSNSIPADRLIALDTGALVAAHGTTPRFAASIDTTLHMSDTAGPISATGSPNTIAAPTRSTFQTDVVALRAILYVSWTLRAGGVSYIDAVSW